MTLSRLILLISVLLLLATHGFSSITAQYGSPLYTTFEPDEYNAEGQNFAVAVNSENLVYVANSGGILEYDGQQWRVIEGTLNGLPVAIDIDTQDRVWTAIRNGLGLLLPDSTGLLRFEYLIDEKLDSLDMSAAVWRVRATHDGIYFMSPLWLVRFRPSLENPLAGETTVWPAEGRTFTMCCEVDSTIYIRQARSPINRVAGDTFEVIPEWADITQKETISHVFPVGDGTVLISSFNGAVLRGDSNGADYLPGELNSHISGNASFGVAPMTDGRYVLSTNQGMVVFNLQGEVLESIDKLGEFTVSNVARDATIDHGGGFWFPLIYGLVRVEFNRPQRVLDTKNGLEGSIFHIQRIHGRLYVATANGLFVQTEMQAPGSTPHFEQVKGLNHAVRQIKAVGDLILVITMRGLYYIDGTGKASHAGSFQGNTTSFVITPDNRYCYVGSELQGLRLFRIEKNRVVELGLVNSEYSSYDRMFLDGSGNLWGVLDNPDLFFLHRAKVGSNREETLEFEHFAAEKGINSTVLGAPFVWQERLYILTRNGLLAYNSEADLFEPALVPFPADLSDAFLMHAPPMDEKDRLYLSTGAYNLIRVDLNKTRPDAVENLMQRSPIRRILAVYPDSASGLVVTGGDDGRLFFLGTPVEQPQPTVLLREIRVDNLPPQFMNPGQPQESQLVVRGPLSSIRYLYTLTSYDAPGENQFQYRLVGRDDSWSDWTGETYHDFNDLREGSYSFEVRGRDYSGNISDATVFELRVIPPWYRANGIVVLWVLLGVGIIYLLILLRTRHLKKQQQHLEELVRHRTNELQAAQEAEIREIEARKAAEYESQRLKTITQLATTIAHELNNPLAVILGRIEVADLNDNLDPSLHVAHDSIRRQVTRMNKLVEKLCNIETIRVVDYAGRSKMLDLKSPFTDAGGQSSDKSDMPKKSDKQ